MRRIVIGTRGSALALRQVELAIEALRAVNARVEVETQIVRTEGDRNQTAPLEEIGGQGVFVKDIETRLLQGEIDLAVHSLKDMPAQTPEGLTIGACLPREDARDVLLSRDRLRLEALRPGARIGTDSRRRSVQLLDIRPDLEIASIRGNVETRLRKVEAGEYHGVVLAAAGLARLGLLERASQIFAVEEMLPAVGQGIIAVQCRADDAEVLGMLAGADDATARIAATAERAFLEALGAGCRLPVGAYGVVDGARLHLRGMIGRDDQLARAELDGKVDEAALLGSALAAAMTNDVVRL